MPVNAAEIGSTKGKIAKSSVCNDPIARSSDRSWQQHRVVRAKSWRARAHRRRRCSWTLGARTNRRAGPYDRARQLGRRIDGAAGLARVAVRLRVKSSAARRYSRGAPTSMNGFADPPATHRAWLLADNRPIDSRHGLSRLAVRQRLEDGRVHDLDPNEVPSRLRRRLRRGARHLARRR